MTKHNKQKTKTVYVLLDQRSVKGNYKYKEFTFEHVPFYVGIGNTERPTQHAREALRCKDVINEKLTIIREIIKELNENPKILIFKDNISNKEALELEAELIYKIGRVHSDPSGPLTNIKYRGRDFDTIEAHKKKLEKAGYDYLNYNKDGSKKEKLYYKEGDDWKITQGRTCVFWNNIPWLNLTSTKESRLAWYYKDEIYKLHLENPTFGNYRLSKECNRKIDPLKNNGTSFNRNTPGFIIQKLNTDNYWTKDMQKIWMEWKELYNPFTSKLEITRTPAVVPKIIYCDHPKTPKNFKKAFMYTPWKHNKSSESSRLGWYFKNEIQELHNKNPRLKYRKFSQLVNRELNLLEKYGMELDEHLPIKIVNDSKKWTSKNLDYWKNWKSQYIPLFH